MGELRMCIDAEELFNVVFVCASCGTGVQIDMTNETIEVHNFSDECQGCGRKFERSTRNALRHYRSYCDALRESKKDEVRADFKFSVAVDSK